MNIKAYDLKKKMDVIILQFVSASSAGIIMGVCMASDGTLYEAGIKNLVIKDENLINR